MIRWEPPSFWIFHLAKFLFKNESLYIILFYFIFPQMYDYKFNSFSHVKLICDSLKLAKWCIFYYWVICNNFAIREKSSLSLSFYVWPSSKCVISLHRGKSDTENDLQFHVLSKYIHKCKICILGKSSCDRYAQPNFDQLFC